MTLPRHAYELHAPPLVESCAVFSSPHSGRAYPLEFVRRARLSRLQLRLSEDAHVDELFGEAPRCGAPLLAATAPRAFVDLNRGPGELDPALIDGVRASGLNPRISAGLGVVPRVVAEGMPIYEGKISVAEARRRIERYHAPYHERLARLVAEARRVFGLALLFDCHSMPSDALRACSQDGRRPDIVLGDRYGASAAPWVMDAVQDVFDAEGFLVARNAPFAGGYITQLYGRPARGIHAVQIEIDRSLYLDEPRIRPGAGFEDTCRRLAAVVSRLTRLGAEPVRLAAE
ncbi:MAG: N-formylglutamate amidohydrolase [Pseudomonadota bacterium]